MLLLLLLIQCKISLYLGTVRPVRCFVTPLVYWSPTLRVQWSLDSESAAMLFHAFVTSRIDYCNILLAGALKAMTDKLQVSWMWLHVLLVIPESSIAVWGSLCTSTFIGSTCRHDWSSSSCQ